MIRQRVIIWGLHFSALFLPTSIAAVTVRGESGDQELNFTVDVPDGWEKYGRMRNEIGYVMILKRDLPRRISIDVHAYRDSDPSFAATLLRLKARWLSVYDEHVLLYRAPIPGRAGAERQMWQVRLGKQRFRLLTALLISDGKVLKLGCLAPENEWESYEPAFENALYSFAFDDTPSTEFKPATAPRPAEKPQLNFDTPTPALIANTPELKALMVSVKAQDAQGVQNSIRAKVNLNARDENGYSPLSYAVEQNNEAIIKMLRESGAVNSIAGKRMLIAIAENNIPAFHGALDEYGDVNFADGNGNTPLIVAAAYGHREVVRILIEMKANLEAVDRDGYTALFYAAQENHTVILEQLIAAKANISRLNRFGFMPIHIAAARGHAGSVSLLIQAGADVNAKAAFGTSAAYWAALNDRREALELLLAAGAKDPRANRDLDDAAKSNNVSQAATALGVAGIDVNMQDVDGFSALMHAAENGAEAVAQLLLDHKAKPDLQSREGYTALSLAAARGHEGFVKLLISRQARMEIRDHHGRTALHRAVLENKPGVIRQLLKAKSPVDLQDRDGMTPLMHAALMGNTEVTKLLVDARAKSKLKSKKQLTAIDLARQGKHSQIVQLLQKAR